jgi:hypothetical protein
MADPIPPRFSMFAVWRWPNTPQGRRGIALVVALIPLAAVTMYYVTYTSVVTTVYSCVIEDRRVVVLLNPQYSCDDFLSPAWKSRVARFFEFAHSFDKRLHPEKWSPKTKEVTEEEWKRGFTHEIRDERGQVFSAQFQGQNNP